MSDECEVRVVSGWSVPVIYLEGDITTFSDATINNAFSKLTSSGVSCIVMDFSATRYINSAGIAILVSLVTETEKLRGKLHFSGLAPHYRRVMDIVGITEYVALFDTAAQACEAGANPK